MDMSEQRVTSKQLEMIDALRNNKFPGNETKRGEVMNTADFDIKSEKQIVIESSSILDKSVLTETETQRTVP